MTRLRLAMLVGAALICAESSDQAPTPELRILPDEVSDIIEDTPCPEVSGLSAEECLVWLTPDSPQPADADAAASDTHSDVAGALLGGDGLRGRAKTPR